MKQFRERIERGIDKHGPRQSGQSPRLWPAGPCGEDRQSQRKCCPPRGKRQIRSMEERGFLQSIDVQSARDGWIFPEWLAEFKNRFDNRPGTEAIGRDSF